ncbi:hypothetical protein CRYUN_Cryun06bG0154800 [Craigia yunnanensis]
MDTDRWEFANDGFVRGQKGLLKNIARRKYSQGSEQHTTLQQQPPKQKEDSELVKLRQYQETADNKVLLLKDRLQGMEKSQQQLLSFLIMAMQSPGFLVQLVQPKENNWRMAEASNMLEQVTQDDGMKDFWMNIDFVEVLMDESHTPFIPPDSHDDGAWEKLLLANAFPENNDNGNLDKEGPINSDMEMEVTGSGTHLEKSCNFEHLLQNMR